MLDCEGGMCARGERLFARHCVSVLLPMKNFDDIDAIPGPMASSMYQPEVTLTVGHVQTC